MTRMTARDGRHGRFPPSAAMKRKHRPTYCCRLMAMSVVIGGLWPGPVTLAAESAAKPNAVAAVEPPAVQAAPADPLAAPVGRLRNSADVIVMQLHTVASPPGAVEPAASLPASVRRAASLQQALQQIDRIAAAIEVTESAACRRWLCDTLHCLKRRLIQINLYEAASAYAVISATQLLAAEQITALENVDVVRRQQQIAAGSGFAAGQVSGLDSLEIELLDAAAQTIAANRLARERLRAATDAAWACDFTAECFVAPVPLYADPCVAATAAVAARCELRAIETMANLIRCNEAGFAELLGAVAGVYHAHLGCLLPQMPAQPHLSLLPWIKAEQLATQEAVRSAAAASADALALNLRETISRDAVAAAITLDEAITRMDLAEQAMHVAEETAENLDRVSEVRRVEPSERYAAESDLATRRIEWLRRIAERNQAVLNLRQQTGAFEDATAWISDPCPVAPQPPALSDKP